MSNTCKDEFSSLRNRILDDHFGKMNEMQKKAVLCTEGPMLILAGAGSGKTTVIINRIVNIIRFGSSYHNGVIPENITTEQLNELRAYAGSASSGAAEEPPHKISALLGGNPIAPWQILAITFTNKAAGELKERLSRVLGAAGENVAASTFHSACARILRQNAEFIGYKNNFTVYDTDDCKRVIKECQAALNIDDKIIAHRYIMSQISRAKDKLLSPIDYEKEQSNDPRIKEIAKVYKLYQRKLVEANAMDFDDLLTNTVRLFKNQRQVLSYYQNRFKYVMVDEYQDTNKVQYELIRLLCEEHKNLCVVGDDDQSIYKFRGATIENILNFEKTYKNATIIRLEQNYRSTQNILEAANGVISNNVSRKGKRLWTQNLAGEKICIHTAYNEIDEAQYIVQEVLNEVVKGRNYSDFAVLYRMNSQSNAIEKVLVKSGIPYRIIGGHRFYERREIRDLIAYLNVINNPTDEIRLRRIINQPKRAIGERTISKVMQLSAETGRSMIDIMRTSGEFSELGRAAVKLTAFASIIDEFIEAVNDPEITLAQLYRMILEKTAYIESIRAEKDESETRIENINELLSNIIKYEEENGESAELSGFLEEVSLMTDLDNYDNSANSVVLMTMHAAKGLEFPVVLLPGFEEGIFPGAQSNYDPEELEEERRLAYVGITRAKEKLCIVNAKTRMIFGNILKNIPSRFIGEIPSEIVEKTTAIVPDKPVSSRADGHETPKIKWSFTDKSSLSYITGKESLKNIDLTPGDTVRHKVFGNGTVLSANAMGNDTLIEINFEKVGIKKLMANFARLEKLA